MASRTAAWSVAAAVCLATAPSAAEFTGLRLKRFVGEGWREHGYSGLVTYRLVAVFDGTGDDGVLSVYGIDGLPMGVGSTDGTFHNDPLHDALTAPVDHRWEPPFYWGNQWDTYVTIGTDRAEDDHTRLTPDFATETANLAVDWTTEAAGWFASSSDPHTILRFDGTVLLAQFTLAEGEDVEGCVNLLLRDNTQRVGLVLDSSCLADLDGSGAVDFVEVIAILTAWGACAYDCVADLDGDGVVDAADLVIVLESWGPCA